MLKSLHQNQVSLLNVVYVRLYMYKVNVCFGSIDWILINLRHITSFFNATFGIRTEILELILFYSIDTALSFDKYKTKMFFLLLFYLFIYLFIRKWFTGLIVSTAVTRGVIVSGLK